VTNRKEIAKNYVKTWFVIDCIAIIPFDLLLDSTIFGDAFKGMRAAKLYKLMKLTRLMRILKVIKDKNKLQKAVTQSLGVGVAFERLSFFILIFVILQHISTCCWILVAKMQDEDEENWIWIYGKMNDT
jgi:hypothetical protein